MELGINNRAELKKKNYKYFLLTLPGHYVPTKPAQSLPSSAGQGRKSIMKGSCVKIRAGIDQSPVTVLGKADSTLDISLIY